MRFWATTSDSMFWSMRIGELRQTAILSLPDWRFTEDVAIFMMFSVVTRVWIDWLMVLRMLARTSCSFPPDADAKPLIIFEF